MDFFRSSLKLRKEITNTQANRPKRDISERHILHRITRYSYGITYSVCNLDYLPEYAASVLGPIAGRVHKPFLRSLLPAWVTVRNECIQSCQYTKQIEFSGVDFRIGASVTFASGAEWKRIWIQWKQCDLIRLIEQSASLKIIPLSQQSKD